MAEDQDGAITGSFLFHDEVPHAFELLSLRFAAGYGFVYVAAEKCFYVCSVQNFFPGFDFPVSQVHLLQPVVSDGIGIAAKGRQLGRTLQRAGKDRLGIEAFETGTSRRSLLFEGVSNVHIGESVAVLIAIEQHRGVAHQIYFHQWIIRVSVRKSLPNPTKIVERECI